MRKRIYEVVEMSTGGDIPSAVYDIFMIVTIIASLVPLAFKRQSEAFVMIEYIAAAIFIIDYIARWLTADYKLSGRKAAAFVIYPFTPMAIIDLLSVLPSLTMLNSSFKLLRLFRLLRAMRVMRAFKIARYSKSIVVILNVFKKQRRVLGTVATLAAVYVLLSALVIFNVEPESFNSFFDAVYWATVSLTTVGYGDIYPVSAVGRLVTMFSSVFGIAVIALPSGVITAGYLSEISKEE